MITGNRQKGMRGIAVTADNQDWSVRTGSRYILRFTVQGQIKANWQQLLFLRLNDLEGFNGQTDLSITGPTATITGTVGGSMTARDLKNEILNVVDDYINFDGSSVYLEADVVNPLQANTGRNVSTRAPIVDRTPEPDAPPRTLEPEPDPVTGEPVDTGDGTGQAPNGTGNVPVIPSQTSGFSLNSATVKYALLAGVAFLLLSKK